MRTLLTLFVVAVLMAFGAPLWVVPQRFAPRAVDIPYPFYSQEMVEEIYHFAQDPQNIGFCNYAIIERLPTNIGRRIHGVLVDGHTYWRIVGLIPFTSDSPGVHCGDAVGLTLFRQDLDDDTALVECLRPLASSRGDLSFFNCVTGFSRVPNPAIDMQRYMDPGRPPQDLSLPLTVLRVDGPGTTLLTNWGMCHFSPQKRFCQLDQTADT